MNNWINLDLLTPPNIMIIGLILTLLAYGGFVIHNNLASLTPSLTVNTK